MHSDIVSGSEEKLMLTSKQEVEQLLKNLPDNSSHEDIQYHLYVLEKIKRDKASIAQDGEPKKMKPGSG
ncbi:MAG: hypothetical protein ABW077_18015 [Candidatus Thiodiazotropha endolucinida]